MLSPTSGGSGIFQTEQFSDEGDRVTVDRWSRKF